MAERLIGAFPSLVVQGVLLGRFYWLLVSDKRSIFVPLRPRVLVDSLGEARRFVARVHGLPADGEFDLAQRAAESPGVLEVAHAGLRRLSVRRRVNYYLFEYSYQTPADPFSRLTGSLVPPREYLGGKWAGTAVIRALQHHALAFRDLYVRALPAAAEKTEWNL